MIDDNFVVVCVRSFYPGKGTYNDNLVTIHLVLVRQVVRFIQTPVKYLILGQIGRIFLNSLSYEGVLWFSSLGKKLQKYIRVKLHI